MTSFLEVDAANESFSRTASRKTVVAAKTRIDERFGDFLRQATTAEDFAQRLALVQEDAEAIVKEAAEEFGGTAPIDQYLKAIIIDESLTQVDPKTASVHESRKVKMCPFHKDVVDISLAAGEAKAGFDSMAQHWGGPRHCEGEGYEGSKCNFKPGMVTQTWWDERAEKAEQRRQERAEQAAELEAQQGDEIIEEPVAEEGDNVGPSPVEEPVAEDNVVEVDFGGGTTNGEEPTADAEIPMSMAASTKEADGDGTFPFHCSACGQQGTYDPQKGNPYREVFSGKTCKFCGANGTITKGEAPSKEASAKTADGGPEPVMDKRKWTPQSVPFLDDVDDPNGPNPSQHKDIVQPIKPENADKLTEIGEQVTERQDVGKSVDYAKTDGQGGTWTKGERSAVSSTLPNDAHTNPIVELVKGNYDGFLPANTVQQAIAAHRGE